MPAVGGGDSGGWCREAPHWWGWWRASDPFLLGMPVNGVASLRDAADTPERRAGAAFLNVEFPVSTSRLSQSDLDRIIHWFAGVRSHGMSRVLPADGPVAP